MMNLDVPTLGLCLGHEIIAVAHRCRIHRLPDDQNRKALIALDRLDDPIFAGLAQPEVKMQKKHRFLVTALGPNLECLAHSEVCPVEVFRHETRPVYGFQGHPEVSGSDGLMIMANFLAMWGLAPADV